MLLTEINNAFLSIKILLADLLTSTNSIDRELGTLSKRLAILEGRQPVIYVTAPSSPYTGTDAPYTWPDRVTCANPTTAANSPLGPFRERAPKTALTKAQQLEDDFNARANPSGTTANHTKSQYVPAPRGERVSAADYGCNIL